VDAGERRLLVRRAAVGVIHRHTLSLRREFEVLQVAHAAGVKVPEPVLYIGDLDGREAFVMERIPGETIGRRIVRMAVPERLPQQMAEELAKIHGLPPAELPFLEEATIDRLVIELDEVGEPHPAIELGLWWLREHRPPPREPVVVHGDFRIGNLAVDENGLVGVLDWEFTHLDDPARDLSFGLVRAWRFGADDLRLGGIGDVEPYLERYNELTGVDVRPEELDYWELAGNVGWAIGCLTQAQRHLTGQDRSVELAILGRLGAEVEYEICHLLERQGVT
jgi:aminoglycoside phosphotransferase (APT) family kinase protein